MKDDEASILRLSVVKQGELSPAKNLTCVFGPEGGTVGRKDCTWIFEDPRYVMVLSRKHFEISFRKDHYVIIDHSTNGTFINDSTQKLEQGQEHRIADGDRILIGEYLLLATLEQRSSETPGEPQYDKSATRSLDNPPTSFIPGGVEYQRFDEPGVIPGSDERLGIEPKGEHPTVDENLHMDSPIGHKKPFGETEDEVAKAAQPLGVREEEHESAQPSMPPTGTEESRKPIASDVTGKDETVLFRAFLEGLGIPNWDVPEASQEEYMRMMGEALQQAINGLIQSLHLRDEFKKEFIVERTVISPVQNNPLKYSVNVEDALTRAFLKTNSDAYLPIVEAIQQSFEDIAAHHIALVAGMQAAVSGLLGLFSPSQLERNMSRVSFMDHVIPQFKHARMWEAYLREYQAIMENAEEDFQELLGEKFTKAYSEQVSALRLAEFGKAGKEN